MFDETRLDDADLLAAADPLLRGLASSGAAVRRQAAVAEQALAQAVDGTDADARPRAVVAAGPDSRLLRAVLEPVCPVPFVAWPGSGLPGWAGALDLVIVLAPAGSDSEAASAIAEARRRGSRVVVACPPHSMVSEYAVGPDAIALPIERGEQLAAAVVMLQYLGLTGLGPQCDPETVATALDDVSVGCSPHESLVVNPAKLLAIGVADTTPVLWGGSVLAARAARRVSEAIRKFSGRPAVAGDAEQLLPLLERAAARDVFADPFDDEPAQASPSLIILDDGHADATTREHRGQLQAMAQSRGFRTQTIPTQADSDVARYAALVHTGGYLAAYLGLGLGHDLDHGSD